MQGGVYDTLCLSEIMGLKFIWHLCCRVIWLSLLNCSAKAHQSAWPSKMFEPNLLLLFLA